MPYAHTRITEDSCIYSENSASMLVGKIEKAIYTRISFQTVTYSHTLHLVAPLVSLRHDPILTDDVILKGKKLTELLESYSAGFSQIQGNVAAVFSKSHGGLLNLHFTLQLFWVFDQSGACWD